MNIFWSPPFYFEPPPTPDHSVRDTVLGFLFISFIVLGTLWSLAWIWS